VKECDVMMGQRVNPGIGLAFFLSLCLSCGEGDRGPAGPAGSTGAAGPRGPSLAISTIDVVPVEVEPGDTATVTVDYTYSGTGALTFEWTAGGGSVEGDSSSVRWIAPLIPGHYTLSVSLSDDSISATGRRTVRVATSAPGTPVRLLDGLEYPSALWVTREEVYFAETAGRNTGFGGKIALDRCAIPSGEMSVVVDGPENSDGVVVASDGTIYLTSYQGTIPGESGSVSSVDPTTGVETHLLDIEIASTDMTIDAEDNIYILGSSDEPDAKSLYRLPASGYTSPEILGTGFGRVWCLALASSSVYYSDQTAIRRVVAGGPPMLVLAKRVISMTIRWPDLYYADYFAGTIGKIDLESLSDETLLSDLDGPMAVRLNESGDLLFYLEVGTVGAEFKDGSLSVIEL
jgi:hypothetical protein